MKLDLARELQVDRRSVLDVGLWTALIGKKWHCRVGIERRWDSVFNKKSRRRRPAGGRLPRLPFFEVDLGHS
jgi:hypothetical protein